MVAIDSSHDHLPLAAPEDTGHAGQIILFSLLISALLAVASLSLDIGYGTGWHVAAEMVSRFSLLLFVAAMMVEPLGRLVPVRAMQAAAQERSSLILGFVAASAVALGCVLAPAQMGLEALSAPTLFYAAFTAMVLVVMLFSSHPATLRLLGAPAWRAMQRIATAFFWIAFLMTGIERMVGPHRPDGWPGFAVLLLVAALLIRFADSFVMHYRGGMAEKVG